MHSGFHHADCSDCGLWFEPTFFYYKLTVNVVAGWRCTCSSSDEVSDSESEPVAKNRLLLMFKYTVANTN